MNENIEHTLVSQVLSLSPIKIIKGLRMIASQAKIRRNIGRNVRGLSGYLGIKGERIKGF
jgi:hypothetical protein